MNTKINEFEVMAPVGSRESLAAAIQAGADSVYFGIGKLNMRSHSANHFTIDDLREIPATSMVSRPISPSILSSTITTSQR